ncbi:hypothetical protein E2F47_09305 [Mycobacterium eburneum]|nr:hypothetical protein [Mycobacterium eburneum]TDH55904.1 hypothetical protein E2F47_09305 [Mycobacterium eburneum]
MAVLTATLLALVTACSDPEHAGPYGAQTARLGESLAVLGWNLAVSNLRWEADQVRVDVDAAVADPDAPHAKAGDIRFGLYGALGHPLEATGIGSCADVAGPGIDAGQPLSAPSPDRLTGTVCLGPMKNRSAVRGVYVYSPADRIAGSTVAYGAAFPVGVARTDGSDTGLALSTGGVTAWRADGTPLTPAALGDPTAFTGNGYLLLNLVADAPAGRYRDDAVARGGPLMLVVAPSQPVPGLDPACAAAGSSALVLPEASLNAVHVNASLCSHGEINAAVLYATVSVIGTHAAVWTVDA